MGESKKNELETAWLIEHPRLPLWLGVSGCGAVDWVTSTKALRFARKQDAEDAARLLGATLDVEGFATEHMWTTP